MTLIKGIGAVVVLVALAAGAFYVCGLVAHLITEALRAGWDAA